MKNLFFGQHRCSIALAMQKEKLYQKKYKKKKY